MIGGSSGSALSGALKAAQELGEGKRCVVILPDSIRNYLTKFADDRWMYDNEFYEPPTSEIVPEKVAGDIVVTGVPTISPSATCDDAVALFKANADAQYLPMVDDAGVLHGLMSTLSLSTFLFNGGERSACVKDAEIPVYRKIASNTKLNTLRFSLDVNSGVCIVADQNDDGKFVFKGLITSNTLFHASF